MIEEQRDADERREIGRQVATELEADRQTFLAKCRAEIDEAVVVACRIIEATDLLESRRLRGKALAPAGQSRRVLTEDWIALRRLLRAAREAGNHLRIHGVTNG